MRSHLRRQQLSKSSAAAMEQHALVSVADPDQCTHVIAVSPSTSRSSTTWR